MYLSDFSTTVEWDPSVVEAERLGTVASARTRSFASWPSSWGDRTRSPIGSSRYDPPHAVTFLGENATVISRDRITFEPIAAGTRVTYDARSPDQGPLRLADPLLQLAFNRVGDRALAGLRGAQPLVADVGEAAA